MKNKYGLLILIMLSALLFRAARVFETSYVDKDAVIYVSMADEMAEGRFQESFSIIPRLPPLYIALMAAGKFLGANSEKTGIMISLLAGVLLILPVFIIAKQLGGEKAALAAAFLTATHPYLVRDSAEVMRDSLFFLLLFSSLAFALKASLEKYSRLWYFSGIFAGLSILTRSEGNEILIAYFAWIAYEAIASWRSGEIKSALKKLSFSTAALLVGFVFITVPAQIFLHKNGSDWTIADKRIIGYMESFLVLSKNDILKSETP